MSATPEPQQSELPPRFPDWEWDPVGHPSGSARRVGLFRLHLLVFLVGLGLWTWKLLEPNPVPEAISVHLTGYARFVAAKSLHAAAYGFLTLLAVTLPVPAYWRWYFAGLLALHGVATEIGQTFVPGRHGCIRDVLIDWAGIGAALVVWRLWVRLGERGRKLPVASR